MAACSSQPEQTGTLGDIDKGGAGRGKVAASTTTKSKEEIKRAYYDYLKDAAKDDKLRVDAATRIAELELALGSKMGESTATEPLANDAALESRVRQTIALLMTTLQDFPDAAGNDHVMYQLAKAHDQIGESEQAVAVLEKMVVRYPKTPYYIEAKFRIAENAFVTGRYFDAEDAYTDVLRQPNSEVFQEKTLFKRGWARYKQELYQDALDDYFAAVARHQFTVYEQLVKTDQELFDEYFRAIGLAFTYMGGAPALAEYFGNSSAISGDQNPYIFQSYKVVSQLQLKQERYSDAVATYQQFAKQYPYDTNVIKAGLAVIKIWKDAQFFEPYSQAFAQFYQRYQPNSNFWRHPNNKVQGNDKKLAIATIRENIVLLAGRDHNQYRKSRSAPDFTAAQEWYERYLKDYADYARQDKIYQLYAELLSQAGQHQRALPYYELAAFDGDIVLDKDAAYAAVFLTNQLLQKVDRSEQRAQLLNKHLNYAQFYVQLYPTDKTVPQLVQNAVQLAFKAGFLNQTIKLANILPDSAPSTIREEVSLLKAQAYFDQQEFVEAEMVYLDLLVNPNLKKNNRQDLGNKLALAIYRQAEAAHRQKQTDEAARQFLRIYREVPESELAPTAMYDAIALFMNNAMWNEAIDYLNLFKRQYPNHRFQADVSKKLSVAYLKADRGLDAAREFEKLSDFSADSDEKMAALWQAAELYQSKNDLASALRAYRDYAHNYPRPYAQNMEAMQHVADIYQKLADQEKRVFWLREIIKADNKAAKSAKTDRTQYLAANASFSLAELRLQEFGKVRLVNPLPKSLQNKKAAMQEAVKLYGQAAVYGHPEFVTRATLAIGDIYRQFAVALLESERPRNLNADELEQYNILLEDQAFPFEDKAIEFYETNVSRIAGGAFDLSIKISLQQLKELFPARYGRLGKVETSVPRLTR